MGTSATLTWRCSLRSVEIGRETRMTAVNLIRNARAQNYFSKKPSIARKSQLGSVYLLNDYFNQKGDNMARTLSLLILMLVLLASNQLATAQDDAPIKLEKIDFPGGTVAQYIELLNSQFEQANVVVDTPAASFVLPSIRLTTDSQGAVLVLHQLSNNSRKLYVEEAIAFYPNSPNPIAQIKLEGSSDIVKVINVKSLLTTISQNDLLDVAKFGLEVQGTTGQVKLSLHPQTGILFVKGEESAVKLVLDTIDQLSLGEGLAPPQGDLGKSQPETKVSREPDGQRKK